MLVPQVLADVALEMEAARAHGVAGVKHLQVRRRGGNVNRGGGQQVQGVNLSRQDKFEFVISVGVV